MFEEGYEDYWCGVGPQRSDPEYMDGYETAAEEDYDAV